MFRAQDSAELKQSLNSQFNAMAAVAERHAPALEWLQAQQSSLATADYNAFVRFSALNAELRKFKADNPASTAAQLAKLVGNDFNQMDIGSCADILNGVLLPSSRSDLATRLVDLRQGALRRCQSLQQQQAAQAWKDLADYFNQYLAGRFPFAYSLEAADAEPGRVRHLLKLMETRLPQVREGLAQVRSPDLPAAEDFVRRLEQAQRWLGPLFERDKSGLLGVALDIDWRSDRSLEHGADQVIAWSLYSGDQESRFPGAQDKGLTWNVGDPLKIMLRWAKNGSQRPADDPRQASLAVADLEAGWSYQGSWALLRMMRAHFSRQRPPNVDYTEFPLVLQLPVYAPYSPENEARMFLRLSLMSLGGKTPLSIQPLPVRAAIAVRDAVAGHRRQHRRYPMTLPLSGNALSLEVLLEPIDPGQPCGPSLRYDPDYDRLRELRREDDSSCRPASGEAEAKRADWAAVEQLASELLQRRSEDLMLAAWLGEAWLQRGGLGGLQRALVLLAELCERYPEEVHPQAQDGDQSWRVPPIDWLLRRYAELLHTRLPLMGQGAFAEITLYAWQRLQRQQVASGDGKNAKAALEAAQLQQKKLDEALRAEPLVQWQRKRASLLACQQQLQRLEQWCDRCLGELASVASRCAGHRAMAGLAQEFIAMHPQAPLPEEQPPVAEADASEGDADGEESLPASAPSGPAGAPTSREDAYRQLLLIADYLARTEPHSPVPYLIKRAVEWGNKPLSELLAELINADSEARRVWSLLGVLP